MPEYWVKKIKRMADIKLVRKYTKIPYKKELKIVIVGRFVRELRYLSRCAKVLYLPFPPHSPKLTTIPRLIAKLTSTILSFRPNIIFSFPCYPFGFPSAVIARLFRKAHVSFAYGNDIVKRRTKLGALLIFLIVKLSHGVICDYQGLIENVKRRGGRNVVAIPTGIDTSDFHPSTQVSKLRDTIVSTVNFNLAYSKGVDLLIRAVKEIPDAHLILLGEGTQRNEMMSFARKLKISDRIAFTGRVPHEDVWTYLKRATLFVMVTRVLEGSNKSVLEAMFSSLPVVVTRTGGLPELIVDGVNGLVVEPENVKDLTRAISTLLKDPKLRKKMGRNNKLKAKKYSADILAAKRCEYLMKFSRRT